MADAYVLVRLDKIAGADLNVFDFDYDLTWAAFFMSAEGKIYGRYGGRDASSADKRLSPAGLKYALAEALAAHRREPPSPREAPWATGKGNPQSPLLAEQYPAAKRARGGCIHCHQVYEFRREAQKTAGTFQRDDLWVYPLPENVGLSLEIDEGNRLRSVAADSPAGRAGLRAGDVLKSLGGMPVASFADAQYGLHRAPAKGELQLSWQRDGMAMTGKLGLTEGWRKTNVTWRPSMLDILPALCVYGQDLSPADKKALGLPEKRLAFRQVKPVLTDAKAIGVQENDVVLGIDGLALEMTEQEFHAYIRRNHLVGERKTLNLLRNGKPLDLSMTLR